MKYLIILIMLFFIGCTTEDTGINVSEYEQQQTISGQYKLSSSSSYNYIIPKSSSSSSAAVVQRQFPTHLKYVGITKKTNEAYLVMKNNSAYVLSVNVNYTITCSINGKEPETTTKTQYFSFKAYEQLESNRSIIGYISGMKTIECHGYILSVSPGDYERNFQAWHGEYPISINE